MGTYDIATSAQRDYVAARYKPSHYFNRAAAYFDQIETLSLDCDGRKLQDEFRDYVRHCAKKFMSFDRKRVL
jgi:hypothetical protein